MSLKDFLADNKKVVFETAKKNAAADKVVVNLLKEWKKQEKENGEMLNFY